MTRREITLPLSALLALMLMPLAVVLVLVFLQTGVVQKARADAENALAQSTAALDVARAAKATADNEVGERALMIRLLREFGADVAQIESILGKMSKPREGN